MKVKTTVWATFSFVGFHAWPGAPDEVAYLRSEHRHEFRVRVECCTEYRGSDRVLEFHSLKRYALERFADALKPDELGEYHLGAMSCEDIAVKILRLATHASAVEVSEDG